MDGKFKLNGKELLPYVIGYGWPGRSDVVAVFCPGCGLRHFHRGFGWRQPHCEIHHPDPVWSFVRPGQEKRPRLLIGRY
jgi:hypothetical protein